MLEDRLDLHEDRQLRADHQAGDERQSLAPQTADLSARRHTTRRRSVLHVTQPVTEGVGNYVRFLTTRQPRHGHRVGLACLPGSSLASAAAAAGVEVYRFDAGREPSLSMGLEVGQLREAVRAFKPDIVHLHSSKAGMVGRLAIRGRHATVFQPHAWSFEATNGLLGRAALNWERLATRWTDAIITVSEGERDLAEPFGIRTRSDTTILNPVDTDRFTPPRPGEQAKLRSALGLPLGPVVLCVGRLCPQKGQDLLLDAWQIILAAAPSAQLVLVGDGPDRAELEARRTPNTTFLGDRDDIPDMFRIADVVALPSRWEGMSLAMLEAMAAGRPVVATDVGGAAETIGKGAGAVVAIGDREQMAEEIVRRLAKPDLAESEGTRGRALAQERHSLTSTLEAVDEVYDRVLRRRAATGDTTATSERG